MTVLGRDEWKSSSPAVGATEGAEVRHSDIHEALLVRLVDDSMGRGHIASHVANVRLHHAPHAY